MRRYIAAVFITALASTALAQSGSPVKQSGNVTNGHAAYWATNGVIADGGTAADGKLTSLGVTNNGGPGICASSAPLTAAARNQLCLSVTTNGGARISSYSYGTATNAGITFDVNGSVQGFPLVTLPVVNNDLACFDGTTGQLKDCGLVPFTPTGVSPIVVSPSNVISFNFSVANTFLAKQSNSGATTTSPGWYTSISGDSQARLHVGVNASDVAEIAFGPGNAVRDTFIDRFAAASIRFGGPPAAAPVSQTLSVQNVVSGTSDTHGVNFNINGSRSTGTGRGGDIIFNYSRSSTSGSTQNSSARLVTIGGQEGNPGLRIYPIGNINTLNFLTFGQGIGANGEGTVISSLAANGTTASPTAVTNNQELTSYSSYGWDGSGVANPGNPTSLVFAAIQDWTPTKHGQGILFQATPFDALNAANEVSIVSGLTVLGPSEFTQSGKGQGTIWAKGGYYLVNALSLPTAPVATTFCTSPSIPANNGTAAFTINVGTSCGSSTGTITLPAATTGWVCDFHNVTAPATNIVEMTGGTTTTVTLTNYVRTTGVAGNWTDSNIIRAKCTAY